MSRSQWRLIEKGAQHGSLEAMSKHVASSLSSAKGAQLRGAAFAKEMLAVGVVSRAEKLSKVVLLGGDQFKGRKARDCVCCRN